MQAYREPDAKKTKQVLAALRRYDWFYASTNNLILSERLVIDKTQGVKTFARKILRMFKGRNSVVNFDSRQPLS
ncbi:hypothetical protein GCM10027299_52490 [Larkinella ripae]